MSAPSTSPDPRSVITPEAFHVSPELLGLRLASPRRRLAAILLDLVVIGVLTVVTRSFALVLGIVVAIALLRASTRGSWARRSVFEQARRVSIGCLGLGIGGMTLLVGTALFFEEDLDFEDLDFEDLSEVDFSVVDLEDLEDGGLTIGLGPDGVTVRERAPAEELVEPRDVDAIRDGVSLYSTDEALEAYTELLRSGSDTETDRELRLALEARLAAAVAADTLVLLQDRVDQLEEDVRDEERRRERAEAELEQASSGIVGVLAGLLDDLGLGFGWAALYTTVLLALTNGQTLGKRFLGIRVLRLDGEPMNWWVGFERAGGYAAGFATGLLGFAQVFWDANRQAIHDRIVGTVVVREGAEQVHDREGAT